MKSMKLSQCFQVINPTYRYIKLIPNTGVRNYKSDEIASYVNSMYKDLNKRVVKHDKKLIVEAKCKLSYYIYITKNDVEFYFIVPEYHLNMIKQRINNVWSNKVTIQEVNSIPKFSNKASKCQLAYKNLDSLSLASDRRNNDLLASNLNVIEAMTDNDSVGIIYNFIPASNRQKKVWFTHYEEDMEKYKNNKSLEKFKIEPKQIIQRFAISLVKGLNSFIQEIQMAIGKQAKEVALLNELSDAISDKKQLSKATLKKKNDVIVNTQIAVITQSDDITQQNKLMDSVVNSFDVIREDNQLVPKTIKHDFEFEDFDFKLDEIRCSDKEAGANFICLPGRELLREYKNITKVDMQEKKIPEELQTGIINLGNNSYKETTVPAYLSTDKSLSNLPIAICGGSRSGKTTFSINVCKNIIDAGEGLIIPDFIKDTEFAEKIKAITPPDRLIDLDLSNPDNLQAFAFNEIKITKNMNALNIVKVANMKTQQVMALVDATNHDGSPLTSKMRRYLLGAGKVVFTKNNASLKNVIRLLQDHKYRMECIENLNPDIKDLLSENMNDLLSLNEYDKNTKEVCGTKESKIEGILDRINLLKENINMELMFNMSPENNIDFVKAMNEGKVILIRLREDEYFDTMSKNIIITFFISKLWLASQIRGKQKNIKRCTVLIDEIFQTPMAQRLIGKQLVQSAKFGLKYIFTLHYLNQLYPDVQEALKNANSSYMLLAGCDKKAFKELEEEFKVHDYEQEDLINLKRYHSLNLIKTSSSYSAFITKLPPELK